jgi:hypothetical protein
VNRSAASGFANWSSPFARSFLLAAKHFDIAFQKVVVLHDLRSDREIERNLAQLGCDLSLLERQVTTAALQGLSAGHIGTRLGFAPTGSASIAS